MNPNNVRFIFDLEIVWLSNLKFIE